MSREVRKQREEKNRGEDMRGEETRRQWEKKGPKGRKELPGNKGCMKGGRRGEDTGGKQESQLMREAKEIRKGRRKQVKKKKRGETGSKRGVTCMEGEHKRKKEEIKRENRRRMRSQSFLIWGEGGGTAGGFGR